MRARKRRWERITRCKRDCIKRCVQGVRGGYIVPYGSIAGAQMSDENCIICVSYEPRRRL